MDNEDIQGLKVRSDETINKMKRRNSCPIKGTCITCSMEQEKPGFYEGLCNTPGYVSCPDLPEEYRTQ